MANSTNLVELTAPGKNPKNVQATKYYVFNETGNVMMASTLDDNGQMEQSARDVFAEVSVFFAAMTKAISSAVNPKTKKQDYSLYDYGVLGKIIDESGLFVQVTEEDVIYKSNSVGMDFSKDLIEALIGLATGAGEMTFAAAMLSSIGKEASLKINASSSTSNTKVGNIIFVCEYLLGMPMVSALVVYCDTSIKENKASIGFGPCYASADHRKTSLIMHKDTYLFVTPTFIKTYAGDLESAETDPEYAQLISTLQNLLFGGAVVDGVTTASTPPAPVQNHELTDGDAYIITGEGFDTTKGSLAFYPTASGDPTLNIESWATDSIKFSVTGTLADEKVIALYSADDPSTPIAETEAFKVVKTS